MSWTINLVTVLGLTAISGSIMTLFWWMLYVFLRKRFGAKLIYLLLRVTMLGYMFPVTYFILTLKNNFADTISRHWFRTTPFITQITTYLIVIWGGVMILLVLSQLPAVFQFKRICLRVMKAPSSYQELLQKECNALGIKRKIQVYQGYNIVSPFIWGIFSPAIYLPVQTYSDLELRMILRHECSHYLQGDIFWKPVFGLCSIVFWFNPLVWIVYNEMRYWAEGSCDVMSQCEEWSTKQYFSMIYQMMEKSQGYMKSFAPMWIENENELKWRLNCMKNIKGSVQKGVTVCAVAFMLVSGSCMIYAAETNINSAYGKAYWSTVESEEETAQPVTEWNEQKGTIEEFSDYKVEEENSEIATYSSVSIIDWSISSNVVKRTKAFNMKEGKTIVVSVGVTPSNKYIKLGIQCPDDSIIYVRAKGEITHTFTAPSAGEYRVFALNENSSKVTVEGCYRK